MEGTNGVDKKEKTGPAAKARHPLIYLAGMACARITYGWGTFSATMMALYKLAAKGTAGGPFVGYLSALAFFLAFCGILLSLLWLVYVLLSRAVHQLWVLKICRLPLALNLFSVTAVAIYALFFA